MSERYYEEELRYLREEGRAFATAHPSAGRLLGIDAVGDRDPCVERLLEGFAFLTARIRRQLDDGFPRISEALVGRTWPHLLLDLPSLAMVQLRPRRGLLQETRVVARGVELLSEAVGPERVACRFITTQPVALSPLRLAGQTLRAGRAGRGLLRLDFELEPGLSWQRLRLSPLRLHVHAEAGPARELLRLLTTAVESVRLEAQEAGFALDLPAVGAITPAGLSAGESLLPHDAPAMQGRTLLLEYFAFPEKFLFVDLAGLNALAQLPRPPRHFSVTLALAEPAPPQGALGVETIRLYCTPAVNLFRRDIEPLLADGRRCEYPLRADASAPSSVQVHSVTGVQAVERHSGERSQYAPADGQPGDGRPCFSVRREPAADGSTSLLLSLYGPRPAGDAAAGQSVSVEAWCSNGDLPREALREDSLCRPGREFPQWLTASSISRPSLACPAPRGERSHWQFLSHLSASWTGFADAESLRGALRAYNRSADPAATRHIDAIREARARPVDRVRGGAVVRGVELVVALCEADFEGDGDAHLFGRVLSAFLAQHVSINTLLDLVLVLKPSERSMRFEGSRGTRWPM